MQRSIAGKSLHPVGLGCMNLSWAYGSPPSEEDAVKLLNRALDVGYDHLDTANIYGGGKNEELLAKAVMLSGEQSTPRFGPSTTIPVLLARKNSCLRCMIARRSSSSFLPPP